MAKVYTSPKYELKAVGITLQGKTAEEKSTIKARELAKIKLPKTFNIGDYLIEIIQDPYEYNGLLYISVKAWKAGVELFVDNPLIYKNPPIMVHDDTYYQEVDSNGLTIDKFNYVEDLEQALKEIIVETIRVAVK